MSGLPPESSERSWLAPRIETEGIQRYVAIVRDRWWLIAVVLLVCLGGATAYLALTPKTYETHADVLVTPVSQGDQTTLGLGLIQTSNDPTRDVSTAARFITTTSVAGRVAAQLQLNQSPRQLLGKVSAQPVAQSSIISVTASSHDPQEAADLANAFARQTVAERTEQLQRQIDLQLPSLRQRIAQLTPAERAAAPELGNRLSQLESLKGRPDPTISLSVPADVPTTPSSPRPALTIAAALIAGLILGLGAAFAAQALDPRLRNEEQLRALYRVPILARVPLESRSPKGPLEPSRLSGLAQEAFRTLRSTLAASHGLEFRSRSVLVTGSSPSEGKTTTAINLAMSLVQAGNRVILIEADMHRPTIGATLGVKPRFGISSVLIRQVGLEDALEVTEEYGPDLRLLLVDRPGLESADRLSLPTARTLVSDAEQLADFVVIDAPPLTEVTDALPLVREVGDVLVVVRIGRSKLRKLLELGELLQQQEVSPTGVALVGVERPRDGGYYYAARRPAAERGTVGQ